MKPLRPKQHRAVGLTGPFSDANFGDYAMAVNNLFDLAPDSVTLFVYDSNFVGRFMNDYLPDLPATLVEVQLVEGAAARCRRDGDLRPLTPVDILQMVANSTELEAALAPLAEFVVSGGGFLNGLWSKPHRIERLLKILVPLLLAHRMAKPIRFTGNSYGPFGDAEGMLACVLASVSGARLGARDALFSPMWLSSLGIHGPVIPLPDDLLFINERLVSRPRRLPEPPVGPYVALETYLSADDVRSHREDFRRFAQEMRRRYGLGVVVIPFNIGHGGMDQARFLSEQVGGFHMMDIDSTGYLPIEDAVEIIQGAELVLCTRYHAMVLALAGERPVVAVMREVLGDNRYYYNKNAGLLRQIFAGVALDESCYLHTDFYEAMESVLQRLPEYQAVQRADHANKAATVMEGLREQRLDFLRPAVPAPEA